MKLVFPVDAIFPPLTGIGRYAWELALRLPRYPEIEAVRYFTWGRWIKDIHSRQLVSASASGAANPDFKASLRKRLAGQCWAVDALSLLAPVWMRYRLRPFRDHLFHSPNYFVPPGTGPAIATVHDLSIYRYPETHPAARVRYFRREFPKVLGRVEHLITDSEAVRREVVEQFGWPEHKITAIPLGVDPSFRPRAAEELLPALAAYRLTPGMYSLCVSTLEPRKNIERLLAAYESLPDSLRRSCPLVLAGGRGWLNRDLDRHLDRAQRQGWAHYLGYVSQEHLPAIYAGAKAFCFPSLYEGFGLPVLESMASGVPVLTSNRSSLPEAAGGAAWLVDPEDFDALREGLLNVLTHDQWRAEARMRGLAIVQRMTWDECARRTVGVYRQMMGPQLH